MLERMRRIAGPARTLLPRKLARSFVRREEGAAAVEFALVAAPFLALLFAIIETGLYFFAGQTLETAVADTTRLIMTGQAQGANLDKAGFKQELCKRIYGLFDCDKIQIDVRKVPSFAAADLSRPPDAEGTGFVYQPGAAGDIVVVRVVYPWPVYVSLLGFDLSDAGGGTRLMMATAAFRNEPF
jgi:Flp pilus assembly protein TadG